MKDRLVSRFRINGPQAGPEAFDPEALDAQVDEVIAQAALGALLGVTRKTVNVRESGATTITEEAAMAIKSLIQPPKK